MKKRFLSVISCLILLVAHSAGGAILLLPDIDGNKRISLPETLYILSALAGQSMDTTALEYLTLVDVDSDGLFGLGEAILSLSVLSGHVPDEGISVVITDSPAYPNTDGTDLTGEITGIIPSDHRLATFIRVEDVWWNKPSYAAPSVAIRPDGTWSCDITTGGNDAYADRAAVFLIPSDTKVPICNPCYALPDIPGSLAFREKEIGPAVRRLSFSGYEWTVKRRDFEAGPGGNYFSDSEENVNLKGEELHLAITKRDNRWFCAEVILTESLGYGTYIFHTDSRIDRLDPNTVFGLFTWDTEADRAYFRELDIEFARWGDDSQSTNAQFAVQPCSACPGCGDRCTRFTTALTDADSRMTHYLVWRPETAEFRSYKGTHTTAPPLDDMVHVWLFNGAPFPQPGRETVRMNLWLHEGEPPATGIGDSVVISRFQWIPDTVDWQENPDIQLTQVPPYPNPGHENLQGYVTGVSPSDYRVVIYINVGSRWWIKPYENAPLTLIQPNGTWSCDITTGGNDHLASAVAAFLIPVGYSPPICSNPSGCAALPVISPAAASVQAATGAE